MNYTSNYNLNLPEGRDVVEIGKLNDNFTKLDSTVKAVDNRVTSTNSSISSVQNSINNVDTKRKPVTGSYSGNGDSSRTISLGFQPSLVLLADRDGFISSRSGIALSGYSMGESSTKLSVSSSGFTVYYNDQSQTNNPTCHFLYAAWR